MKVKQGQSFLDLVVQETGSIENAFEMSLLNERSITEDLSVGTEITASKVTNRLTVNLFGGKHKPATGINNQELEEITPFDPGIGEMIIGQTFIVR